MARGLVPRGHLGFCHYERSEVIQKKQVLLAMGLPRRAFSTARNDKKRVARRLPRRVFYTARNDKKLVASVCLQ